MSCAAGKCWSGTVRSAWRAVRLRSWPRRHWPRKLGIEAPQALIAGDTGTGEGSSRLYARLVEGLGRCGYAGLTFHYLMPDVEWHNKILWGLESLSHTPMLVADAGFMYAAKMSGFAAHYDLFTPDAGKWPFWLTIPRLIPSTRGAFFCRKRSAYRN